MDYTQKYLHKIYPTTKLIYLLVLSVISLIAPAWWYSYILFGGLILLAATGSSVGIFLKKVSQSVLILFILIFILQAFFRQGEQVLFRFWIFSVKREGILYAAKLCGILLVVASSFVLYFQTTEISDLVLSLEQAGVSPTISYVVLSTMQMIPQTKMRSEIIMNAQQARGIETKGSISTRVKAFFPMLAPLILSSFSGIEERALTLESRAFSAPIKKTNVRSITKSKWDTLLRVIPLVILAVLLVGRFTLWR